MKSVKEKSNEYAREYLFSPLPQRAPNIHFEAGANYVLDEIEKMMQSSDNVLENHTKCKSAIFRLQTIIEQLKK